MKEAQWSKTILKLANHSLGEDGGFSSSSGHPSAVVSTADHSSLSADGFGGKYEMFDVCDNYVNPLVIDSEVFVKDRLFNLLVPKL